MSTSLFLRYTRPRQPSCPICNKTVALETAKTDEDGHAVHEKCYLDKISGIIPPNSRKPPAKEY